MNLTTFGVLLCAVTAAPCLGQATKTATVAAAGPALSAPLPVDPNVRIGKLANGLRYYVRKNSRPEKRAEFRLAVNAASILETDDQLGLAHFAEHMAFNGTTHFKKNDLIQYLETVGVRFGADVNAYTGFDETVYILSVPTDSARIVAQALTILEDWARGQTFDSSEVANERGVVREEWRLGKGASDRMMLQAFPIMLAGSLYAKRLPIGNEQSIMSATPARLRSFYDRWYRPDLQAIIAVGDFDPAEMVTEIKKRFSAIPIPSTAPNRTEAAIPDNKEPLIAITSDKEAITSTVSLIYKLPAARPKTVGDYRTVLMTQLYTAMLNDRFAEIARSANAPFLNAFALKDGFLGRTRDEFNLSARVSDGEIARGLAALLTEAKRIDEHGFLPSEVERAKIAMMRDFERAYTERDKTNSDALVESYLENFLNQGTIPGIANEYKLAQQLMPTIAVAEINKLGSSWITDENRVILAQSPLKKDVKIPTREELLAVFETNKTATVAAYTESLSGKALIENAPRPGKVVSGKTARGTNVTEWVLSNGAHVLIKHTDFKADEVLFAAYGEGGTSMASDSDYVSAWVAAPIMRLSGVGNFNQTDLTKKLAGKVAAATATMGVPSQSMNGAASPKDLETMFQLIYLNFTAPRIDLDAAKAYMNRITSASDNFKNDPNRALEDTILVTMSQHNHRSRPQTAELFQEVNFEKAFAFFKDRFANASDFSFTFVGNTDTVSLKPLVEKYIASLPSSSQKQHFHVNGGSPPKGVVERTVQRGVESKATTAVYFTGPCEFNEETNILLRALTQLFQIKLDETLREQMGGTYGASVGGGCTRVPQQRYSLQMRYGSSPENVDKLSKSVFASIDSVSKTGPAQSDLDKVKEALLRSHEVDVKTNQYWISSIPLLKLTGEDYSKLTDGYNATVKSLTVEQLRDAARKYLDITNYARFVLLPQNPKPVP